MTPATLDDAPRVAAFLDAHAPLAMFPRANLNDFGMQGGHDYAVSFWFLETAGQITDVLTVTDNGNVMPLLPSGCYGAAARALLDRPISMMVGNRTDTRALRTAMGLQGARTTLDEDEPHLLLDLADLVARPGRLVDLTEVPAGVIQSWMHDYETTLLMTPPDQARLTVVRDYARRCETRSHKVLVENGVPVAITGFNAQLPQIVQIGGVYTPPAHRNRGHARTALSLHLAEARARGVKQATLFSGSAPATRAYHAIGFRQIGEWALIIFDRPQRVRL